MVNLVKTQKTNQRDLCISSFSLLEEIQELRKIPNKSLVPFVCHKLIKIFDAEYVLFGRLINGVNEKMKITVYDRKNNIVIKKNTHLTEQFVYCLTEQKHGFYYLNQRELFKDKLLNNKLNMETVSTGIYDNNSNFSGIIVAMSSNTLNGKLDSNALMSLSAIYLGELIERENLNERLGSVLNELHENKEGFEMKEKIMFGIISELTTELVEKKRIK